jgi:hypothetical protein
MAMGMAKVQIFNIGHDYALLVGNFVVMMEKPKNLDFENLRSIGTRPLSS